MRMPEYHIYLVTFRAPTRGAIVCSVQGRVHEPGSGKSVNFRAHARARTELYAVI